MLQKEKKRKNLFNISKHIVMPRSLSSVPTSQGLKKICGIESIPLIEEQQLPDTVDAGGKIFNISKHIATFLEILSQYSNPIISVIQS